MPDYFRFMQVSSAHHRAQRAVISGQPLNIHSIGKVHGQLKYFEFMVNRKCLKYSLDFIWSLLTLIKSTSQK